MPLETNKNSTMEAIGMDRFRKDIVNISWTTVGTDPIDGDEFVGSFTLQFSNSLTLVPWPWYS